jgi:hypothetical protein
MVKKSNSVLGFLRRNLRISNEKTKEAAYKTLVRPHLKYCCNIWNPYTKELRKKSQNGPATSLKVYDTKIPETQ